MRFSWQAILRTEGSCDGSLRPWQPVAGTARPAEKLRDSLGFDQGSRAPVRAKQEDLRIGSNDSSLAFRLGELLGLGQEHSTQSEGSLGVPPPQFLV
jgi:hypothetical protein